MNILWLVNVQLPEASLLMNEKPKPFGGWLIKTSQILAEQEEINLFIAFPKNGIKNFIKLNGNKIIYYAFKPVKDGNRVMIKNNHIFTNIINQVKPDIVHIHGTEFPHTLSMINVCNKLKIKTVISIQGLVSVYEKHMYANLPFRVIYGFTLRNLLKKDNVVGLRKLFKKRGKYEIESIKKVRHIIGRTTWDKANVLRINPNAKYYFCNETLREDFYNHKWNINNCEKYSIFLSQGHYPIKGLHYVLEAMPAILKRFPKAKLYVGGKNITKSDTLKDKLLMTYYGKYIKKMIHNLKLEGKVIFTGPLNEKEMCQQYLKSHVFVCPSSIENSPNSLGEAMILGVPSVASYVGGIPDMLENGKEGFLYQSDAPYMLAYYVCKIFENDDLAIKFSDNARRKAMVTHDIETNTNRLIEIYRNILEGSD
jgi:glycosyltransferase involved in cell wall biosynthesis